MWVKITKGPEWSIGLVGKYDGKSITFTSPNGEPYWYNADDFEWIDWSYKF